MSELAPTGPVHGSAGSVGSVVLREPASPRPVPRRPVLVTSFGRVVGNAVVIVSPDDYNWWRRDAWAVVTNGEIEVRIGGRYDRNART
jgi:hypothetical protein